MLFRSAKLSPWTLDGTALAQDDRPRTARRKATREGGAKALSAGQCDESTSCRAAGAIVALAPSRRGHVSSTEQTKKKARTSKNYHRRRTTPTDELSHPLVWHPGAPAGCTAPIDHINREIAEIPFGRIP